MENVDEFVPPDDEAGSGPAEPPKDVISGTVSSAGMEPTRLSSISLDSTTEKLETSGPTETNEIIETILVDSYDSQKNITEEANASKSENKDSLIQDPTCSSKSDTHIVVPTVQNDTSEVQINDSSLDDVVPGTENPERLSSSIESDVQIIENTPTQSSVDILNVNSFYGDSSALFSDSAEKSNRNDTADSYKTFHPASEDTGKFISPVYASNDLQKLKFDVINPAYSTPNEAEPSSSKDVANQLTDSTESLLALPTSVKKIGVYVEITALMHLGKDAWSAELLNISCEELQRVSEGSGYLADLSKPTSPSSSVTSLLQIPPKTNRISVVSSSSSSSLASSAATFARIHKTKSPKDEPKLTPERVIELQSKWLNSGDILKVLDYVDRAIMSGESCDDPPSKFKKPLDEQMEKIEETLTPISTKKQRPARSKRQPKVKFTATSSDVEIAKKRRRADSTDIVTTSTNFTEGDSVFAKWSDRKFYAAHLGPLASDGKWKVYFFDGDEKMLLEEFIIKAEEYTMVGHNVYASQGDDNFTLGIITGCELKSGTIQYIVARDKGDISVPCQFIYITESQARQIRGKLTLSSTSQRVAPLAGNCSLSNRSTRSRTRMMMDSPKPSSSGLQTEVKPVLSDSDDEDNENANNINLEDVAGIEPESHGVYENCIKLKGKTVTGKMRFARTKSSDTDATVLGPVPEDGSKYFKNLHVLLTCTRSQSPKSRSDPNNSDNNSTDSENFIFSTIPFVKDRLKLQLVQGGAVVYDTFDDVPAKLWKSTYLISNRPNISAKYIQCIAAGIKCICHEWVIRCCSDKKRLPVQELPLGWCFETERHINYYDRKTTASLKNINLLVVDMGDRNFYKFWSKICKIADIPCTKLTRDSNLDTTYAVISESGYRDELIDRVYSQHKPLVTTTWLIQSLLLGAPRPFKNHKSYLAEIDFD